MTQPAFDDRKEPAALSHIERTLADAYRKEIEPEENVWRSLPYFAATLALQLAATFQVIDRLPSPATSTGRVALGLLVLSSATSFAALCFLGFSIYPARLSYTALETELLDYAETLIRAEQRLENLTHDQPMSALVTLKTGLARQYAVATKHNRRINDRRKRLRSVAGLATVASPVMTLLLIGVTFIHYLPDEFERSVKHGSP